jgi:hypothetical protein
MNNLSATKKGLFTGLAMVASSIAIFFIKGNFQNNLQYITYCLYVAGILWTLMDFKKQDNGSAKFKDYFSQGFKCFIVVTLIMVIFTFIFLLLNPEMKEQMAVLMRADMIKTKTFTPAEIDDKVKSAKKFFVPALIMGAVFGYLLIGSVFTAIIAAFLSQKRND